MSSSGQEFFHVDRDSRLHEGQEIRLRPAEISGERESLLIRSLLPGGVSEWGQSMLESESPLVVGLKACTTRVSRVLSK